MFDFTLGVYRRLCAAVAKSGYRAYKLGDYHESMSTAKQPRLFLRHDVDYLPKTALDLARIEIDNGLVASYFFRCVKSAFDPKVIAKIRDMGMEVGYHYETFHRAKGDYALAWKLTREDLEKLRAVAPIKAAAMHGNALSPFDNRTIWKQHDFRELGIEVEAYLTPDFSKIRYLTDTGRNWHPTRGNMYDQVAYKIDAALSDTNSVIAYLTHNRADTCILTHPNRWSSNPALWTWNLLFDNAANTAKGLLKFVRRS